MTKQTQILLRIQPRMNFVRSIESELNIFQRYIFYKHLNKRMRLQALQDIFKNKAA